MEDVIQETPARRLRIGAIVLAMLVTGVVLVYSVPFTPPVLPDAVPAELAPRFEEAHAYIWPEILAGWMGPAVSILAISLILVSGIGRTVEQRYGDNLVKRWPMRILFLVGLYFFIAAIEAPRSARSFFHAREFGLTQLTYWESVGLSAQAMPFALVVFIMKYLLVFCCMAIFRTRWWLVAAAMVLVVFNLVPERVSRTVPIDPITNYSPLPEGPYRQAMDHVSSLADEDLTYFVEDRSERSETVNMYMTGRVGREYVVVTDTLLDCLNPAEVAAVLAHEYGHKVSRVMTVTLDMFITVATLLLIFYGVHLVHHRGIVPAGLRLQALVQILLAAQLVALVSYPLTCAVYRHQERTSDQYALGLTQNAQAFRGALLKVSAANLEPWSVPGWVYFSTASHPLLKDRVRMADTFAPIEEPPEEAGRIVFDSNRSGNFGIYTMAEDGSDIRVVVDSEHHDVYPDVSPDGEWVAYARTEGTEHFENSTIRMCRPDGADDRLIDARGSFPRFHAATGELYFMRDRYEIMIKDPHQEGPARRLFPDSARVRDRQILLPALSPDGSRLAFTTDAPGQWHVAIVNLHSGDEFLVGQGCEPFWVLDGQAVLWINPRRTRERTGISALVLEDRSVLSVQDDDAPWGHEYFPWAAPDSSRLLWSACPPAQHPHKWSNYQIFMRRGLDAPPVRLSHDPFTNRWPKWFRTAE